MPPCWIVNVRFKLWLGTQKFWLPTSDHCNISLCIICKSLSFCSDIELKNSDKHWLDFTAVSSANLWLQQVAKIEICSTGRSCGLWQWMRCQSSKYAHRPRGLSVTFWQHPLMREEWVFPNWLEEILLVSILLLSQFAWEWQTCLRTRCKPVVPFETNWWQHWGTAFTFTLLSRWNF